MLKTKKIITISIMLLVMLSLTACTNKENTEPVETPSQSEVVETTPTEVNDEDQEIVVDENGVETSVSKRECKNRTHEGTGEEITEIEGETSESEE